ncbi:MAG: tryptophan-rich sensory protein [Deltaproteobacteria bacterium]|nr:tryptophan-rich sensory protein [Deltaproteobacteria bacterium]
MNKKSPLALLGFLLLSLFVQAAGAFATFPEIATWYRTLQMPSWNPPPAIFGPVWTVLYALMAVAAWLAWREVGMRSGALRLYLLQLMLNLLWSFLFFWGHSISLGLIDILLLWLAIGATTLSFWRVRPLAGALMLPYWAWVSFAAALNFAIWRLNRG